MVVRRVRPVAEPVLGHHRAIHRVVGGQIDDVAGVVDRRRRRAVVPVRVLACRDQSAEAVVGHRRVRRTRHGHAGAGQVHADRREQLHLGVRRQHRPRLFAHRRHLAPGVVGRRDRPGGVGDRGHPVLGVVAEAGHQIRPQHGAVEGPVVAHRGLARLATKRVVAPAHLAVVAGRSVARTRQCRRGLCRQGAGRDRAGILDLADQFAGGVVLLRRDMAFRADAHRLATRRVVPAPGRRPHRVALAGRAFQQHRFLRHLAPGGVDEAGGRRAGDARAIGVDVADTRQLHLGLAAEGVVARRDRAVGRGRGRQARLYLRGTDRLPGLPVGRGERGHAGVQRVDVPGQRRLFAERVVGVGGDRARTHPSHTRR